MIALLYQYEHYFQTDSEIWQEASQCYLSLETKLLKEKLDNGEEHIVSFMLPDESIETIRMTADDVDGVDYGVFVTDSSAERDFFSRLDGYTQLLISSDKLMAQDITNILEAMSLGKSMYQVKHMIAGAEDRRHKQKLEEIDKQNEGAKQAQAAESQKLERSHQMELEKIDRKGLNDRMLQEEKAEDNLEEAAVVGLGFSEDKDMNNNGTPDAIDYAQQFIKQDLQKQGNAIAQEKMDIQREGNQIAKQKNKEARNKPKS